MLSSEILTQLILFGLGIGSIIALTAIGVTLLFGTTRILNIAYGDVFALSTVLVTVIINQMGLTPETPLPRLVWGLGVALLGSVVLGAVLNMLIDALAFKPFRGASRLAPLIATLGLSFILYQLSLLWRVTLPSFIAGEHRSVPGIPEVPMDGVPDLLPSANLLGENSSVILDTKTVLVVLCAVLMGFGLAVFMHKNKYGKAIRAVAQNPELAQLCGINVNNTLRFTFALSGAIAGVNAFIFVLYQARPYGLHGVQSGLTAFSAAIMGGVGSPFGALLSGFGLGIISSLTDFYLSAQWTPILIYGLLIALLVFRPGGLAGDDTADETSFSRDSVTVLYRGSGKRWVRWVWLGLISLALIYPALDAPLRLYQVSIFTNVFIFIVLALGLTVLLGYAGLLDLGYAISFAIGGYAAALLVDPYSKLRAVLGWQTTPDFLGVLLFAALAAGLFGVLNAALIFRMRADYLAVVTLAYGLIIRQVIINFPEWTGGTGGMSALPVPVIFSYAFKSPASRYYLAFGVMLLIAFGVYRLIRSRAGRAFMAMGEDALAAASFGVNVVFYKSLAFVLGTAIAGIAGALYATSYSYIDPEIGDFRISMMVLAMVIVAGAGSVPGAIFGATVISLYDRLIIPLLGTTLERATGGSFDIRQLSYLTFGLAVYLTVLLRARVRQTK